MNVFPSLSFEYEQRQVWVAVSYGPVAESAFFCDKRGALALFLSRGPFEYALHIYQANLQEINAKCTGEGSSFKLLSSKGYRVKYY